MTQVSQLQWDTPGDSGSVGVQSSGDNENVQILEESKATVLCWSLLMGASIATTKYYCIKHYHVFIVIMISKLW